MHECRYRDCRQGQGTWAGAVGGQEHGRAKVWVMAGASKGRGKVWLRVRREKLGTAGWSDM